MSHDIYAFRCDVDLHNINALHENGDLSWEDYSDIVHLVTLHRHAESVEARALYMSLDAVDCNAVDSGTGDHREFTADEIESAYRFLIAERESLEQLKPVPSILRRMLGGTHARYAPTEHRFSLTYELAFLKACEVHLHATEADAIRILFS